MKGCSLAYHSRQEVFIFHHLDYILLHKYYVKIGDIFNMFLMHTIHDRGFHFHVYLDEIGDNILLIILSNLSSNKETKAFSSSENDEYLNRLK